MKISVNVVTYNEEANIEKCLKSVNFADEIIIVDSKSTDRTIQIVKKYTKKIFFRDFKSFSDIKNLAISKSKGDWILSIDADEVVSPELKKKILSVIKSKNSDDGYAIKRNTFFLGREIKHCGWGRDYQMRLFKRNKGRFNDKIVHEGVVVKGVTGKIEESLYHYSYPDSSSYFEKLNRYTTLQAEEKQKGFLLLRMLTAPGIKFFRMYFIKKGFLDGLQGFVLCYYSGLSEFVKFSKMLEHKKMVVKDSIILRAPNWIGDAVMATVLIKPLKQVFGKVIVVAHESVESVFRGNKDLDELIVFNKKKVSKYFSTILQIRKTGSKCGISLSPSISSGFMLWFAGIKIRAGFSEDGLFLNKRFKRSKNHSNGHLIGEYKELLLMLSDKFDFDNIRQEIPVDIKAESRVIKKYHLTGSRLKVVISPFVQYGPAKMWPIGYWENLLKRLIKKYKKIDIIMLGMEKDKSFGFMEWKEIRDMRGKTSVEEIKYIIKNADIFIGNDSGLMHIADAFDIRQIAIFASTSQPWTGPISKNAKTVQYDVFCSPCFDKVCRYDNYKCLTYLTCDMVLKEVEGVIKKKVV